MKRFSSAASLTLAVVAVLGLASPVAAEEQVPFKGSLEGDVYRGNVVFPYVPVLVEATGTATQFGKFALSFPHAVDVRNRTASGTYTITTANGDTLTAEVTGQATPVDGTDILYIEETATITGGTGRFAGATGSFTMDRWYDIGDGTTIGSFEGTISSPGK